MPIDMKMPRLSDTMEVGTVVKWNVKPGQKVRSGDVVADIETDKATMELQTFDEGTIADLVVPEGQSVKVGTIILRLAESGEPLDTARAATPAQSAAVHAPQAADASNAAVRPPAGTAASIEPASHSAPAVPSPGGNGLHGSPRVFASPLARKVAAERGVDLASLTGTGPGGRIIRKDVESVGTAGRAAPNVAPNFAPHAAGRASTMPAPVLPAAPATLSARSFPLSTMRATIARRLVQSKTTIPHYQVTVSVRMDALLALRTQLNEQLAAQGVKLSVNDFIVRSCALAMHLHPSINARWSEPQGKPPTIDFLPEVNIGVAIALPVADDGSGGGLVVGTIRHADRAGLRHISAEARRLGEKARGKGLAPDEMSDSTFTISNLGMFGVEHFTAIINPPNAAILAVGAAVERPVVTTDPKTGAKSITIGSEMQMTLSSDHRVIDGAMAAAFLATVKDQLEKPATLLV